MNSNITFVTGFFGAPIMQRAQELALEQGGNLLCLDDEIQNTDGRTVKRICMMMGEHEYRNKEYEAVKTIVEAAKSTESDAILKQECTVICCGDGVLHDDLTRGLIRRHNLEIVGFDMSEEQLWQGALEDKDTYHAFMHFGSEEKRREKFKELILRQRIFFSQI